MKKKLALILIGATLFIGGLGAGIYVDDLFGKKTEPIEIAIDLDRIMRRDAAPVDLQDVDFNLYWLVWHLIRDNHVNVTVKDAEMFYGSIAGMVESLKDPHSSFMNPEEAKMFAADMAGSFFGIGAEVGIRNERLIIVAPIADTPAARAGLLAGDRILAIDGVGTAAMSLFDAVRSIRGPKGTPVKLLIGRDSWKEPKEITIVRDEIKTESVKWKMETRGKKRFMVVTVSGFHYDTMAKFNAAVTAALEAKVDGLVLDLRNNPGGLLMTAVRVAGEWLDKQPAVEVRPRIGNPDRLSSPETGRLRNMPTVVLVNEGSASASEVVSGALQDYGKARVIGEKTYGKGSGQSTFSFRDGSELKLTTFLWFTPSGRSIEKTGIAPDETVKMTAEDHEKGRDPQMDRAFNILLGR